MTPPQRLLLLPPLFPTGVDHRSPLLFRLQRIRLIQPLSRSGRRPPSQLLDERFQLRQPPRDFLDLPTKLHILHHQLLTLDILFILRNHRGVLKHLAFPPHHQFLHNGRLRLLRQLRNLKTLEFDAVERVELSVETLASLKELLIHKVLCENERCDEDTVVRFAEIPGLKALTFMDCNVSRTGLERFKKKRPDVTVFED